MSSFDYYKVREDQLSCFNEWADFEGLDLRMSGEFEHSDRETHIAYLGFKAGAQSRQAEIDELNSRINEAIDFLNVSNANDEYYVLQAIKILKGNQS